MCLLAMQLPETAVTLECETTLRYMQDLFDCTVQTQMIAAYDNG